MEDNPKPLTEVSEESATNSTSETAATAMDDKIARERVLQNIVKMIDTDKLQINYGEYPTFYSAAPTLWL